MRPVGVKWRKENVQLGEKELRREVFEERLRFVEPADVELVEQLRAERPKVRADCVGGQRPCPWVSCRHHLALDVTSIGSLVINYPELEVEQLEATCSLDVADLGGVTLSEVGDFLNISRERVRQIEAKAMRDASLQKENFE